MTPGKLTAGPRRGLVAALGCAVVLLAPAAQAQMMFPPFAYGYYDRIEEPPPAPFASRRAVAGLLAREGYRLIGPLGARGDQIVALGEDRRGARMRFLVDPYEGELLSSWRVPPAAAARLQDEEDADLADRPLERAGRGAPRRVEGVPAAPRPAPRVASRPDAAGPSAPTKPAPRPPLTAAQPPRPAGPKQTTTAAKTTDAKTTDTKTPDASAAAILPPVVGASPLVDVTGAEAERKARQQTPGG